MATDQVIARDAVIRQAAFDHIRGIQGRDLILSHEDIAGGSVLEGQRWPLRNPQRGHLQAARNAVPPEHTRGGPKEGSAGLV